MGVWFRSSTRMPTQSPTILLILLVGFPCFMSPPSSSSSEDLEDDMLLPAPVSKKPVRACRYCSICTCVQPTIQQSSRIRDWINTFIYGNRGFYYPINRNNV